MSKKLNAWKALAAFVVSGLSAAASAAPIVPGGALLTPAEPDPVGGTILAGGLHVVDAMVVPQLGEDLDVAFADHPEGGGDALIDECLSKGRVAGSFLGHSGYRTMHRTSESTLLSHS